MSTMQQFTGTKTLLALAMTRGEYNAYRGWTPPEGEDQADRGYLVEYTDGGKANDSRHAGYISWSPADVFEKAYRPSGTHEQRVRSEHADRSAELEKLSAFIASPTFPGVPDENRALLIEQQGVMRAFVDVLARRIATFAA
jgi:hypothetical protein